MPSKKTPQRPEKAAHELTTDEAIERLFHPEVIAHAKRHAREAERVRTKSDPKSTNGS